MKVNKSHIEDLYAFTRKHFVEWYDLQTELVDHLANDIEEVWKEYPTYSYERAREMAFKKFGVFGFMDVIAQRQKAMNKKYTKYLFAELKKWFELPQIISTISLFIIFYISFISPISNYLFIMFYVLIAAWYMFKSIQLNRAFRRRKEISNKKWLLENLIFKQAGGAGIIFASQIGNVFRYSDRLFENIYIIISVTTVATLICLINYISLEVLPNKAEKLLTDTYPEFIL